MEKQTAQQTAMRVSAVSIFWNILLSAFKLIAGIVSNSSAMVSDAVHSASDIFSTVVVMIGVKFANREADQSHPYGHERMECIAAMLLAAVLAVTGLGIGYAGAAKILSGRPEDLSTPGLLALVAALISILVKEAMYWYTRAAANKIHSGALLADAWHHRSDALSSVGSFAGILGARLGFPILDPLAGVVICLFILKAAYGIFKDAAGKMTDKSCDGETLQAIQSAVDCQDGVLGIDEIKTRLFGDKIYVDVEIRADGRAALSEAHEIAQRVHDGVERVSPQIKHCMVHVNPDNKQAPP